jgi:hypothetical protein
MVALNIELERFGHEIEAWSEAGQIERFTHSRRGAYPVRSHAARIRGIVRSRATASAKRKGQSTGGIKRRRHNSHRQWLR